MTQQKLIDAAERVIAMCKRDRLRRVKDPVNVNEFSGNRVCRVCAVGAVYEAGLSYPMTHKLVKNIGRVLRARGDNARTLRTVPDMPAMYALIREAAKRPAE